MSPHHYKMIMYKMRKKSNQDRLSNLPSNVLEAILMLLPLKGAARTSVLSSKWRHTWTAIPHLVFDYACAPPHLDHIRRVNIVDQVLLRHQGPILKFQLCRSFLKFCPDVDRWILFLSNHGIQQLILNCSDGRPHKLPSLLFSCPHLQCLELGHFVIEPPPTITRLANLKILVLRKVSITDLSLKRLLSACGFLEELELLICEGLSRIEILAKKLKRSLLFDTPLLASVELRLESLADVVEEEKGQIGESGVCNLIKVLGGLRDIQKLEVYDHCLKFLATGVVPKKLLTTYEHLKHLYLSIDFSNVNEISSAFCLITSSPCLQKLQIHSMVEETFDPHEFVWEAPGFMLNCLHSMEITGTIGGKNELDLLEFVLANAPLLSMMTIQMKYIRDEAAFLRSLVQCQRASTQVKIKFLAEEED
ncbi:hypothetical protein ACLOJK_003079 [Asimina triloba]